MTSWIHQFDVNGHREQLSDWNQVNWKKVRKIVNNLRKRIFRARKLGQWKQLRRLQKLLSKSYANLLLAVRQITQINKGKRTAGVDEEEINTPEERVKLEPYLTKFGWVMLRMSRGANSKRRLKL